MEEMSVPLTFCLLWALLLVAQGKEELQLTTDSNETSNQTTQRTKIEEVIEPIPWLWFVIGMCIGAVVLPCMTALIMKVCGCCVGAVSKGGYTDATWNPLEGDNPNDVVASRFHACGVTGIRCGLAVLVVIGAGLGAVMGVSSAAYL